MKYPHSNQHKKYTVTVLKPSNRGRNKRGIAAHKPDKARTKRAKRQSTGGLPPVLARSRYG